MKNLFFILLTLLCSFMSINGSAQLIPNYVPNVVQKEGASNYPTGTLDPTWTVTPPTTATGTGTIRISWTSGAITGDIRGVVMHGGLRFDGSIQNGNSQQLNSSNSFAYTFTNLSPGVYTFALRSDKNDDRLGTNNGTTNIMDDYDHNGNAQFNSDHQMSAIFSIVLLPSTAAGNGNLASLTATVPTLASSCLNNDGVIRLSGLENVSYDISISAFPNYSIVQTAVGGIININSRYPGIYPVRIRRTGTTPFRLINVEVGVTGGVACYKNEINCTYNLGPNLIPNANFGTTTGILPGTTTYWNASWADASNLPGDRRYSLTRSTLNADKGITQNNNGLLRAFNYTGRNTHLWGALQSSRDHTGSTTGADGTGNGYYMFVNGNYEQDVVVAVPGINLDRCKIYEFTAWVKNMQPYFPQNKNNGTSLTATYQPIIPRLGFVVAGVIYNFTDLTANLQPADISTRTLINDAQWTKIGVRFRVPFDMPNQEIGIYNFQNGGFGNDFAIDDIYFGEITSQYNLTGQANGVCNTPGLIITMNANNACVPPGNPTYQWQLSTNSGSVWNNTGTTFTSLPNNYTAPSTTTSSWYRLRINEGLCTTFSNAVPFTQQGTICILPTPDVELFGNRLDTYNDITWIGKNESTILKYDLQKSLDGQTFNTISIKTVDPSAKYNYRDYNSDAVSYYRVAVKDNNGEVKYSSILKINNKALGNEFSISTYPNPIIDKVNVNLQTKNEGTCTVNLIDITGAQLKQFKFNVRKGYNSFLINNFEKFKAGIYIIEAELNGMKKNVKVLVK